MAIRRQVALLLVLLLALAGAAVVGLLAHGGTSGPESSSDDDHDRSTGGPAAPGLAWPVGGRRDYEVHVSSTADISMGEGPGMHIAQELSGRLHLLVDRCTNDSVDLLLRFTLVRYVVNGVPRPEVARQLSMLFRARFRRDGTPVSFEFPPSTAGQQGVLEEHIRLFQVVIPEHPGATWNTREQHGTGGYEARYKRNAQDIVKRKLVYLTPGVGQDAAHGLTQVIRSKATIALDLGGPWVRSVRLDEQLLVPVVSGAKATSVTRATLRTLEEVDDRADIFSTDFAKTAARAPTDRQPTQPQRASAEDRAKVLVLVSALNDADGSNITLVKQLRDYLIRFPDLAYHLAGSFDSGGLTTGADAALLHVFELAGTGEAQDVLCKEITNLNRGHRHRLGAIVALGGTTNPTQAALGNLWTTYTNRQTHQAQDLSNTAVLALGSLGDVLRSGAGSPQYAALRAQLVDSLRTAGSADNTQVVLKAMANTGDRSLAGTAAVYLSAQAPVVRAAAAQAVGTLRGGGALDLLSTQLAGESDGRVRRYLVAEGLARLDATSKPTLRMVDRMVVKEHHAGARLAMARYLGDRLEQYPQARETLSRLMKTETSDRNRKYLASVLYLNKR